jgi:hypothetical protein
LGQHDGCFVPHLDWWVAAIRDNIAAIRDNCINHKKAQKLFLWATTIYFFRALSGLEMKTPSNSLAVIGPPFPSATVSQFSKIDPEMLRLAWQLTGPSVEKNMMRPHQLWELFAACYAEGFNHGVGMMEEVLDTLCP